ncbi:fasciclin domain-containing protein [Nonlabens antarcticus]|uniref:fasciclin domain-containing protein n=1 Tax=Nonlabens antarcticus TaxID=392714 RepID=UPI00189199AB|nr:fasciclin domain-containing protein [Nonlabens antarcticus]
MKIFLYRFLLIFVCASTVLGCVDDDDNMNVINGPTALDFLEDRTNHVIFIEALSITKLDQTLDNSGNLTTFAPTDQAFNTFLAANNYGSVSAIPEELLRTIVLYHIQSDVRTADQYNSQYYKTQASINSSQMDVFVSNMDGVFKLNNEAIVTLADNKVSNGVVHVVNNVLDLPSVITLIAANPNYSNLLTALNQEGLTITLENNTDASAPFTVFAPSNAAFTALIASDPDDNLDNLQDILNQSNFDDKLLYHVIGEQRLRLEDFVDGAIINPLGTGTFVLNTSAGFTILDGTGTRSNITATNITAFNGVIHSLDFVLRQN